MLLFELINSSPVRVAGAVRECVKGVANSTQRVSNSLTLECSIKCDSYCLDGCIPRDFAEQMLIGSEGWVDAGGGC